MWHTRRGTDIYLWVYRIHKRYRKYRKREEKETMHEFIEKKIGSAKVFRIYLLVLLILTVCAFVSLGFIEDIEIVIAPIMLLINALWISGVVYLTSFMPFTSSVKWLKSKGMENVADDIILKRPTLPRSKIYCGQRALFSKKPYAIIPYSEIAWVHLYERRAYGIAVEKAVIVYTKDGKKFSLNSNSDEFKWLLENYIIANSPNIIIGYGAEQKARYKQLNPESAEAGKKVKRIWGIVLMSIGAAFFIALLFTFKNAEIVPVTILIFGFSGSGAILYMLGKKKGDK